MKPLIKVVLYLGLLILIVGICLYFYRSYEGFQSSGADSSGSISFCDTNENKCDEKCINKSYEQGGLDPENLEEQPLYDLYDATNFEIIAGTNTAPKTSVERYDMAAELGEFDIGAPVPWDYENRDQDPAEILWGEVHPDVSIKIFDKAFTRELFGSANPATFIEMDNNTGQMAYRSNVFQTTVYTPEAAIAIGIAEAFQDSWTEAIIERVGSTILERLIKLDTDGQRSRDINATLDNSRRSISVRNPITGSVYQMKVGPPRMSYSRAASVVDATNNLSSATGATRAASSTSQNVERGRASGLQGMMGRARDFLSGRMTRARDLLIRRPYQRFRQAAGKGLRVLGQKLVRIMFAGRYSTFRRISQPYRLMLRNYVKKALTYVLKIVLSKVVFTRICTTTVQSLLNQARLLAGMAAATFGFSLIAAAALTVFAGLLATGCIIGEYAMGLMMFSCVTWIPALLNQLVDENMSKCPDDCPYNIKEAFYASSDAGEAGWEIFGAIPVVGDFTYTFGPYLCWGNNNNTLNVKLKENIKTPYYYYDPTLSIYTEQKPYAKVPSPNDPKNSTWIASGISENKEEYSDHYIYKDFYSQYPFLVDFSHKNMLNKMAQYYYDTSRKNIYINIDGTGTFEYISKIYGVISSTELSCDIQCEITEITIDLMRGTKVCERIVDVPSDAPCWYHDRRFYFYIDPSRGISLDTEDNRKCAKYMDYLQTPTKMFPYPSCNDFNTLGSNAGGLSSAECKDFTKINEGTLYDNNNVLVGDRMENMRVACNKRLLMDTVAGSRGARSSWDKFVRMNDNMEKYFVTGCTFVNGTAPEAMDSKNLNAEGTQVGDTIVAVGPIKGTWYPPMVDIDSLSTDSTATVIPDAPDCSIVRSKLLKYGTTSREDRNIERDAQKMEANTVDLRLAPNPRDWTTVIRTNMANSPEILTNLKNEVAKSYSVSWLGCPPGDLGCRSRKRGFWGTMAFQSALGYVGSYRTANVGGVPIPYGAILTSVMASTGVSAAIQCAIDEVAQQEGTFVVNGLVVTSHQKEFLIHHGPTIQYSPGYTPEIKTTAPPLGLYACTNRYTVRKFISIFREIYKYSRSIQKIYRISPMRKTTINSELSCVFNTEYLNIETNTNITKEFKMPMNQVELDRVITYQPGSQIYETNIPIPEAFEFNTAEPPIPTLLTTNIAPRTCTAVVDCTNRELQARLFRQFQERYPEVFIDNRYLSQEDLTSGTSGAPATPATQGPILNPITAWTPLSSDAERSCVFDIEFTELDNYLEWMATTRGSGPTSPTSRKFRRRITMNLNEIPNPTNATRCLFDLGYDDYKYQSWYKKVPVKNFEIPPEPTKVNDKFKPEGCSEPVDCSDPKLMANLATQYNKMHTNTKINGIFRTFTPLVSNVNPPIPLNSGAPPICDYDVEMFRENGSSPLVNRETLRMYLKRTGSGSGSGSDSGSDSENCMYELLRDDSNTSDSGLSLNGTNYAGILETPYIWSPDFTNTIRRTLNNYLLPILGLNSVETIKSASKDMKTSVITIYDDSNLLKKLRFCPDRVCKDPYILQKIINVYNSTNYPTYPEEQYMAERRSIIEFRRAGIASPTRCHVEFIEKVEMFDDVLEKARNENIRTNLVQFQFDIEDGGIDLTAPANCSIKIKPFVKDDVLKGTLDISSDPYGIQSDASVVSTEVFTSGSDSGSGSSGKALNYTAPVIDCMSEAVLRSVHSRYRSDILASRNGNTNLANKMFYVLQYFNPAPNICEYKMQIQHAYYDRDYKQYYKVPTVPLGSNQLNFTADDVSSYIVAKWEIGTQYNMETGVIVNNSPTVTEVFLPDLDLRGDKIYKSASDTEEVIMPYLANESSTTLPENRRYTVFNSPGRPVPQV